MHQVNKVMKSNYKDGIRHSWTVGEVIWATSLSPHPKSNGWGQRISEAMSAEHDTDITLGSRKRIMGFSGLGLAG